MLLLWLFALVAGVANACTLKISGTHGHADAVGLGATQGQAKTLDITAGHVGLVPAHDADEGSNPSPPCLKACDEGTRALAAKAADLLDPGSAPFVAFALTAVPGAGPAPGGVADLRSIAPRGPPARLLFSRLTL
ncbi:MAG: hypothetical protein ABT20_03100 [Rubrivivax sp. SCN 70-15]|nr:MAG: hypothetical protein ABT20_03100 [Rubrivivax sp. SCN 70-15]